MFQGSPFCSRCRICVGSKKACVRIVHRAILGFYKETAHRHFDPTVTFMMHNERAFHLKLQRSLHSYFQHKDPSLTISCFNSGLRIPRIVSLELLYIAIKNSLPIFLDVMLLLSSCGVEIGAELVSNGLGQRRGRRCVPCMVWILSIPFPLYCTSSDTCISAPPHVIRSLMPSVAGLPVRGAKSKSGLLTEASLYRDLRQK